jgi:hypothetical protein
MSGLEVVGVTLGTIPLALKLIQGLRYSPDACEQFTIKQKQTRELARRLHEHNVRLSGVVSLLFKRSGYEDLPQDPRALTGLLKQESVRDDIEELLGHQNYLAVDLTLKKSAEITESVFKSLQGMIPCAKVGLPKSSPRLHRVMLNSSQDRQCMDLHSLLKASGETRKRREDILPTVKFVFKSTAIEKALNELNDLIKAFDRLLQNIFAHNGTAVRQIVQMKAKKLAKGFLQVRKLAMDLHSAIVR